MPAGARLGSGVTTMRPVDRRCPPARGEHVLEHRDHEGGALLRAEEGSQAAFRLAWRVDGHDGEHGTRTMILRG